MFSCLEVIVLTNKQTNKQTPLKTSEMKWHIQGGYATTLGEHNETQMSESDKIAPL